MGIANLKKFFRDRGTKAFRNIELSKFEGKILAIDAYNWLFTYLFVVYKNMVENSPDPLVEVDMDLILLEIMDNWLKFNMKLFKHKIIPLWIKDGKSKNNKVATQIDRKEAREKLSKKRDTLKAELEQTPELERTPEMEKCYRKAASTCAYLPYKHREKFFDFVFSSGIPAIVAEDEGENLACSLFVEGKVGFIWSADTDCCALEGDFIVKKFVFEKKKFHFETMLTSVMREELNMSKEQFRDFCILLGTDFEKNPRGIGPANALKLIRKYGTLEAVEEDTKHMHAFKYKDIRAQLSPYKTGISLDRLLIRKDVDIAELQKFTDSVHLLSFYNDMIDLEEPHIDIINYIDMKLMLNYCPNQAGEVKAIKFSDTDEYEIKNEEIKNEEIKNEEIKTIST